MTDQEIDFASKVILVCACVLVLNIVLLWDHLSKDAKIASGIGVFVFLGLWALIG